jgi:hypothetical protein
MQRETACSESAAPQAIESASDRTAPAMVFPYVVLCDSLCRRQYTDPADGKETFKG